METFRLLLVEDSDDHAELVQLALDRQNDIGAKVRRARSLAEAKVELGENDFDAVLLDLSLPDSDSDKTVKEICDACSEVAVIVLTSLTTLDRGLAAIGEGAQDFISKSDLKPSLITKSIIFATERKRIIAELEEKNEQLRRFAHIVAHEVKKPLQAVTTAFHLIAENESKNLSEMSNRLLDLGKGAVTDMATVTNELLSFAQLETDAGSFTKIDLNRLIDEVIHSLSLHTGFEDEQVTRDSLSEVIGSEVQLRHLFQNLIENAIKYRSEEIPKLKIYSEPDAIDSDRVVIAVEDNGIGIDPANREKVFNLFQRVDPQEGVPGTGIGLGFCKQIVERHDGRIWVEAGSNPGSVFKFTLEKAVG